MDEAGRQREKKKKNKINRNAGVCRKSGGERFMQQVTKNRYKLTEETAASQPAHGENIQSAADSSLPELTHNRWNVSQVCPPGKETVGNVWGGQLEASD